MASVKMPLGDLLGMLLACPTTNTRQVSMKSEMVQPPIGDKKLIKRKSVYLNAHSVQILSKTAAKCMRSESHVMNEAINFYDERGEYLRTLIKTSIREALSESEPAVVRRRALVRPARSIR